MLFLREVQLDLSSKIESILTELGQTYNVGLMKAPVLVSTLPEEKVVPATYLKVEDVPGFVPRPFFRCSGILLLDLSIELGDEVVSSLAYDLEVRLQELLDQSNSTNHTYYIGHMTRLLQSVLREENVNSIKFEFEVQGIERPV